MIRPIEAKDLPKLRELVDWELGEDFLTGLVFVDSEDAPQLYAGAWQRAEVHMALDKSWGTPGARYEALKELHSAMEVELRRLKVGQAVTWFDGGMQAFKRRLRNLGWVESALKSWHRKVG